MADGARIISWNVAGWDPCVVKIRKHHGSVAAWLAKHRIDILCLQETKVPAATLESTPARYAAAESGFESVWAFNRNTSKGSQRRGLNGVATYCRTGMLKSANASPLCEEELDKDGRCLMTDHGTFVLFNVYAPNMGSYEALPYKMRFMHALGDAMQRARQSLGKPVVLAGDLNLSPLQGDRHWRLRHVGAAAILRLLFPEQQQQQQQQAAAAGAQPDAAPPQDPPAERFEDSSSSTSEVFPRLPSELQAALRENGVTLDAVYATPGDDDPSGATAPLAVKGRDRMAPEAAIAVLKTMKLFSSAFPRHEAAMRELSQREGVSTTPPCIAQWYHDLATPLHDTTSQDGQATISAAGTALPGTPPPLEAAASAAVAGMIDSYDYLRRIVDPGNPKLHDRFTCWEQRSNRRYYNIGSRIDYFMVDAAFFREHCEAPLRRPDVTDALQPNPLDDCTAGGRFAPAPPDKSGIPDGPPEAYEAQFAYTFSPVVYTPPNMSDHVAISLWLVSRSAAFPEPLRKDKSCAPCQPHLKQKSITSFFTAKKGSGGGGGGGGGGSSAKAKHPRDEPSAAGGKTGRGGRDHPQKKPRPADAEVIEL